MKAQITNSPRPAQLVVIGGVIAGAALLAHHRYSKPAINPDTGELNRRIRSGILGTDEAARLFADKACYISEARWLLSADPFAWWKVAPMGLNHDVVFDKKYEHGFVVVYDAERKPFIALHTMPNDRSDDPLPNAMGDRNCKIDIFAVTMDASDALWQKRGHSQTISSNLIALKDARTQAATLHGYMNAVHQAAFDYTVPVAPVRKELSAALQDDDTLAEIPVHLRAAAAQARTLTLRWMRSLDDAALARWLNPATRYRLGATGFNSNSGASDIMTLLGEQHTFDLIKAPFCDQSMYKELKRRAETQFAAVSVVTPTAKPGPRRGMGNLFSLNLGMPTPALA